MQRSLIKLEYRQVIDSSATAQYEIDMFNDSYSEFLVQAQAYNIEKKFRTFHEMTSADPRANSLHYKVGFAIGLFVRNLDNRIPGLHDSLGRAVPFESHRVEIIQSDIRDKSLHRIAIVYETVAMTCLGLIGEYFILAIGKQSEESAGPAETFMLRMQPNLSISTWQELPLRQTLPD